MMNLHLSDHNHEQCFNKKLNECGLQGHLRMISDGGKERAQNIYCRRVSFPFSFQTYADPCLDDCEVRCEKRMQADMANVLPNDDAKLDDTCQSANCAFVQLFNHQWLGFEDGDGAVTCACTAELVMMRVRKRSFANTECDVCNVQSKVTEKLNKSDLSKHASRRAANGTLITGACPWLPTDYPIVVERSVHCGSQANNCWGDHEGYPQRECRGKGVYS